MNGSSRRYIENSPCFGCVHFYAAYPYNYCCNYIFDTGHRRPCPPGADCTVKEYQPPRTGEGAAVDKEEDTAV